MDINLLRSVIEIIGIIGFLIVAIRSLPKIFDLTVKSKKE